MAPAPQTDSSIRLSQLRRLHVLWRRWTRHLRLSAELDRRLRHYYVRLFSGGRAHETLQLDRSGAARVIRWLERLTRRLSPAQLQAAGTAGRYGFPERRPVPPNAAAWRALWGVAAALGMSRGDVDAFVFDHYAALGLRTVEDIQSMADLNRVLWGMKAILRRRPRGVRAAHKKAA